MEEFPMQQIDTTVWILIGVVIVVALAAYLIYRNRRTATLRDHFGAEYDRTLDAAGNRTKAEAALREREERVS
jgi:multisubunit Na+/H+ antiporter MnhB subunit